MIRTLARIASALLLLAPLAGPAAGQPNIVFIMVDDLGIGDLASHGAEDMRTPHIDALMAAGCRFDNAYANCPVCSPTRAALLTGRYPDLVGVPGVIRTHRANNWGYLDPAATTLPQVLGAAGYHTAMVGKWHLGLVEPNTPPGRGFDHFKGFLGDMMDDYYHHRRHGVNYMRDGREVIEPEGHATDLFTDWAIDYLATREAAEGPFFLYLAYNAPHTPIQPPADWLAKVQAREPGITERRAKLVALIEHLDAGVGRVVAALEEHGMSGDTVVVFTSDNGGQSNVGARNLPWRGGKQEMWEGGLRVPTCIRWPGEIQPGSRFAGVTLTMDWLPTLAEIAGATAPRGIEGVSLWEALSSGGRLPQRTLFWVRREGGAKYGGRAYYAARNGSMKLLQNTPYERPILVDLDADPGEGTPLEDAAQRRQLEGALSEHLRASGFVPWQGRSPDPEIQR